MSWTFCIIVIIIAIVFFPVNFSLLFILVFTRPGFVSFFVILFGLPLKLLSDFLDVIPNQLFDVILRQLCQLHKTTMNQRKKQSTGTYSHKIEHRTDAECQTAGGGQT